ncbi:MAG: chemotaxis protein CheA [Planctomycetota bacterium]|jgi:two-component system chemotaxis sensor kinase CheA|nr:chemotaxis protein CheA [Planctomycetota bacterium]
MDARHHLIELSEAMAADAVAVSWTDLTTWMPLYPHCDALAQLPGDDEIAACCHDLGNACRAWLDGLMEHQPEDIESAAASLHGLVAGLQLMAHGEEPQGVTWCEPFAQVVAAGKRSTTTLGIPSFIDPELVCEFLTRLPSTCDDIEGHLMRHEQTANQAARDEARGLIHTIKGESGALCMAPLEELTHAMEEALLAKDSRCDALLAAVDWIRAYGAFAAGDRPGAPSGLDDLHDRLAGIEIKRPQDGGDLTPSDIIPIPEGATGPAAEPSSLELSRDTEELAEFLGEAKEHLEAADRHLLELEGGSGSDETLNALFRSFHTLKGLAGFFGANVIQRVAHESENLLDRARQHELEFSGAAIDVIFDAVDVIRQQIQTLTDYVEKGTQPGSSTESGSLIARIEAVMRGDSHTAIVRASAKELTQTIVSGGLATRSQITRALEKQGISSDDADAETVAKALVDAGVASAREVAGAMRSARQTKTPKLREAVKVDAERLDRLVDLSGELVIGASMITHDEEMLHALGDQSGRLTALDKLVRELQELATGLRLVPVHQTFQRMARMVRDLSRKLNKPLEFHMSGEDTELDKSVVDAIGDPLVHMVRNAVDHGLEATPEERERAGKPRAGHIKLRASHRGGSIYIEIQDDGRGLDRDTILAKARANNMLSDDSELADREVWNLIFEPGFSTAKNVSEVSGRGVGMDVVRRSIQSLRGQVDITSTPGHGTLFTIRLPLTMAVIDGMVVGTGTERYIIPTLSIVSSLRPKPEDISSVTGRGEMLRWHESLIPVFRLHELFDIPGAIVDPCQGLIVIAESEDQRYGLLVDELLGQQQVVIKSLGAALRKQPGLSGGAILPDGNVGLIVDIIELAHLATRSQRHIAAGAPA